MRSFDFRFDAPFGPIQITLDQKQRVIAVDLSGGGLGQQSLPGEISGEDTAPDWLSEALESYFAGKGDLGDLPFAFTTGSDFERRVWTKLREIPLGSVLSYAEIARAVGSPRAYRAVGNACSKNRLPLVIPCHRVVGATGPGGFTGPGIGVKRFLLELEGAKVPGIETWPSVLQLAER